MNALTNDTEGRACNRKVYTGCRGPEGCVVWVTDGTGEPKPLDPCWELRNQPYRVRMGRRLPSGLTRGAGADRRSLRSPFSPITSTTIALH